jgi:hypothetical protein
MIMLPPRRAVLAKAIIKSPEGIEVAEQIFESISNQTYVIL